jgi:chondroitin AC lyase
MNTAVDTYINRNWIVEPSAGITSYDYNMELHYVDGDIVEGTYTEGDLVPVKYSSGTWYQADMIESVFTNTVKQGTGFVSSFSNVMNWDNLTTFSEFGAGGGSGQPLPVELTSFNGACDNGVISLAWETASENNSSHFDVEKSRDGESWTVLSTIEAAGTSNEIISYQAVDHSATDGNNYFRLRQVDIDGTENLYDPINVSCEAISVGYFSSYPNPSGNAFQIIVNNEDLEGECVLNMVDAQGKVIERRAIEVKPGINMFVMNQNLNPGMYFLNVSNGSKSTPVIRHSIK